MFLIWSNLFEHYFIFKPWRNQISELKRYFGLYGGYKALIASPYFQISCLLSIILIISENEKNGPVQLTLSMMPNMMGFTIGAFAIVLAISSTNIFSFVAKNGNHNSIFMRVVANFLHFILIQVFAILIAILSAGSNFVFFKFIVSLLMFYAILTALSTGIQLFQMATVFNASLGIKPPSSENKSDQ